MRLGGSDRVRRAALAAALLALVLAAGCTHGMATGSTAAREPARLSGRHTCPDEAGFTCATLTVPLDRSGRVPGTLGLAVAWESTRRARRGVLLVLTGGPGQPGLPFAERMRRVLGAAARGYRIAVVDQRGTGAGALECPALQRAMGPSDLIPPPAAAVRACATALGDHRSLYGTDDVVADLDDLRRALGVRRITLDGVSYGTYVAERYALAHPRAVRALVLDSVVPQSGQAMLEIQAMHEAARVLRLACAAGCPSDPAADLAAVVRRDGDGPRLLDALTLLSIVDPSDRRIFDVPAALREARAGMPGRLDRMLATERRWETGFHAEDLSQGLHAAALCGDFRFPWGDSSVPLAGREAALRRAADRLPERAAWPFDRRTVTGNGFMSQCLPWSAAPTPAPPSRPLPPVPVLLLAGDRDLSTPLPWARREAALAPDGRLVVVRGSGHSVQSRGGPAARRAVETFLQR